MRAVVLSRLLQAGGPKDEWQMPKRQGLMLLETGLRLAVLLVAGGASRADCKKRCPCASNLLVSSWAQDQIAWHWSTIPRLEKWLTKGYSHPRSPMFRLREIPIRHRISINAPAFRWPYRPD